MGHFAPLAVPHVTKCLCVVLEIIERIILTMYSTNIWPTSHDKTIIKQFSCYVMRFIGLKQCVVFALLHTVIVSSAL